MDRRSMLNTSATMAVGAMAGCALPGTAANQPYPTLTRNYHCEQISKLSEAFELMPGDIIYSGTPENVGPVVRGDVIECHIDRLPNLSVKIV
jgi:Fumarylacetoacetate (FAA) hydrolase family